VPPRCQRRDRRGRPRDKALAWTRWLRLRDLASRAVPQRGLPGPLRRPDARVEVDDWRFTITTETGAVHEWDWSAFRALATELPTVDLHCVARWSKLATSWEGVSLDTFLAEVETGADYASVDSYGGYITTCAGGPARRQGVGCPPVR
jgi:DMSO/TMAO reductase YedYZ molybdopterin-dependent catalytic subunit